MSAGEESLTGHDAIDAVTAQWQQGDCVLGKEWFVSRGDPSADSHAPDDGEILEDEVQGLVVVTQTCDIVKPSSDRRYVEVSPLVPIEDLEGVKAGRRPNYAYVAGVADRKLVADIDRTMTVTKNVLAGWTRLRGCRTDEELRWFARALKRKRGRFAFPDDFNDFCKGLRKRLTEKHDRQTPEGDALRRLLEVRVEANPSWDAETVAVMFWFIRHNGDGQGDWSKYLEAWLNLAPVTGRFQSVDGAVVTLDSMTAADYVHSDRLDLDHLSRGT